MRVVIAGGTGLIGTYIRKSLMKDGHEVTVLTRNPQNTWDIYWDGTNISTWTEHLESIDVLINLAGKSVDCRYNDVNKKAIYASRLGSTNILHSAVDQSKTPPKLWINSSTATIYRHAEDRFMDEFEGEIGDGFSVDVATKWEETFFQKSVAATRKVAIRTAIVLGQEGGAYPHFRGLTRVGFGGAQGDGKQMVSWIHEEDLYQSILFIISHQNISGVINISSPNPVNNKLFMRSIRDIYKPIIAIPIKRWMLTIGAFFLRTETELLLKSRWVLPTRLQRLGYKFRYPNLPDALSALK
ncbi:MAG: TIGR01777 family oxidoreductase [Bacteroidia bacterium]